MPLTVKTQTEAKLLRATASGSITPECIARLGSRIRHECDTAGLKAALADCAAIEGALEATELYYASQAFYKEVGARIRVAYINPPPHWKPEDDQMSRNVVNNRGGMLQLFPNETEAVTWLFGPA